MKPRILLCALLLGGGAAAASATDRFDVAVTADDLPAHGTLPAGMTWAGIARSYVGTLHAHGVSEAWGLVNAKRIAEDPHSEAALDVWRAAGYPLGNHTYSHMGLSQAPSLQAWEADARAGGAVLEQHMAGKDWHVLRYPFLDAGGSGARHDGALDWLTTRGYRIADVSLSFDDWAYTETYARCRAKGDDAAIEGMKAGYYRRVDQQLVRMKAVSQRVYGRMIPQVLLTHMGAWSAATLPEVMKRMDAAGARYVTLEQAQSDAAYRAPSPRSGNGALMERRAQDAGIDLSGLPAVEPVGNLDALCR
ncbi:polysaccharide deacetylase family protein [Massilia luteola]|uniref:polysaccharide deacetylase family protein n=1 Tax=Massilia luteola TaxID=3081751 RepID=UPI002ACC1B9C|nr:polysaccharide deacetylase family protein [Massilia sp. Gc5]